MLHPALQPLLALLVIVPLAFPAQAMSYRLPAEPIGPTDFAQCKALSDQFHAIWKRLWEQAWAAERAAYKVWPDFPRYSALNAEARSLRDEASEISSQRSAAHSRCTAQVHAHQRDVSRQAEAARQAQRDTAAAGRSYLTNTRNAVRTIPRDAASAGASQLGRKALAGALTGPQGGNAGLRGLDTVLKAQDITGTLGNLAALFGPRSPATDHDRLRSGAALGAQAGSSKGVFGAFNAVRIETSLNALIGVHEGAMRDLRTGLDEFRARTDSGPTASSKLAAALRQQTAFLIALPSRPSVGISGMDTLASALAEAIVNIQAAKVSRAEGSRLAMEAAARHLAAAEAERRRQAALAEQQRRRSAQAEVDLRRQRAAEEAARASAARSNAARSNAARDEENRRAALQQQIQLDRLRVEREMEETLRLGRRDFDNYMGTMNQLHDAQSRLTRQLQNRIEQQRQQNSHRPGPYQYKRDPCDRRPAAPSTGGGSPVVC